MRIAITGASGFIGRYVLNLLILNGLDVVAVVRSKESISEFEGLCRIVELDIFNEGCNLNCYQILGNPDILIHLAWGDVSNIMNLDHFEKQLPLHYNFLRKMIESGLPSVCVSGTCFEYGNLSGRVKEDMIGHPLNPYGYAKDVLRHQLEFLQIKTNKSFKLTWMRLFYMYGYSQQKDTIFSQLKQAIKDDEVSFKMSGGEQLLDYLPVESVAEKVTKLALINKDIGIVNVCKGSPTSLRSFAEAIVKENNSNIKLDLGHYPYRVSEPMSLWGDDAYLNELINLSVQ